MGKGNERDRLGRSIRRSWWRELSPSQLFTGSFALIILFGAVILATVPGLYAGPSLGWLDALFTATSAVCVTGLIVVDTATWFSGAGQSVVLLLIQLGGLGVVAFTTVIGIHDVLSDELLVPPDPDRRLNDSDTLIVAGSPTVLRRAANVT